MRRNDVELQMLACGVLAVRLLNDTTSPQGDDGEEDDGEDEQPSDEAMFRMDAMVAAVLQKGAAGRPNARESREHLRNFKFRWLKHGLISAHDDGIL